MASYKPPLEQLPIFDNSVFNNTTSTTNGTYLTTTQANLLYLRKTFPDTATALETFSAGISLGTTGTITCGTPATDSTIYNTIVNSIANQTVTQSLIGQTFFLYNSANSAIIPNNSNTVMLSTTVTNTGIYTVCYQARYSATIGRPTAQFVGTWVYVSSPSLYGAGGVGQLAQNLVGYASPYLDLAFVGVAMTSSWTGLINAGASVQLTAYIQYNTGNTGFLLGGAGNNYLSITRIA
jgi:hypothetical protein